MSSQEAVFTLHPKSGTRDPKTRTRSTKHETRNMTHGIPQTEVPASVGCRVSGAGCKVYISGHTLQV